MNAAIRGWCPDLFAPMQSGDGLLVRLKPRLARLSAAQGRLIAAQAARCGNGIIELTGRGNLQLRGLTASSAEIFARFAVESGLAHPDPAVERRRNILVSPLADDAACALARVLEQAIADDPALAVLPGKFGFAVDGGGPIRLDENAADVVLRAEDRTWSVRLVSDSSVLHCRADQASGAALALAHSWMASGSTARPSHKKGGGNSAGNQAVGWLPSLAAYGIGLTFGQMDAATLDHLSVLSERHGDGFLHVTPWRTVILSGVAAADATALHEAVSESAAGLIVQPDDPRRSVSACIGRAGCASGTVDPRADALALLGAGVRVGALHVSGCAKGCAHPGPAEVTLVGADGRYGLVRAGRAGDTALADGLTLCQIARRLGGSADGS